MGMSHTNLLNRVNPNDDTHRLSVEQYRSKMALMMRRSAGFSLATNSAHLILAMSKSV